MDSAPVRSIALIVWKFDLQISDKPFQKIRRTLEDEEGVPLTLDIQMVDVNTCEPIPQTYLEFWSCNSTGVYGGVVNAGNGDVNDLSNLDNTALRGVQKTDEDGVMGFDTLFPGHCGFFLS